MERILRDQREPKVTTPVLVGRGWDPLPLKLYMPIGGSTPRTPITNTTPHPK